MVLDHYIVEIHTEKLAKSIADRMWKCEDSNIVQMGTLFEPNELWVLGSVINGYDSGQKEDIIRAYVELEIQKLVDSMPKLRECKIFCVKSNCADLFYAPYWGKQLKGWISNGKT